MGEIAGRDESLQRIRQLARQVQSLWGNGDAETRHHAALYSPDLTDLNLEAHLSAALDWLKRAQDAGTYRGVSFGVAFGSDFELSYPEATGYIM